MRQRLAAFLLFVFLFYSMNFRASSVSCIQESPLSDDLTPPRYSEMSAGYFTESSPINIDSNQDLEAFSSSGTGIQEDPYVIERLHIVATGTQNSSISVFYTSHFFVIRDCYLETDWACIDIRHTAVGTVRLENNTCISNSGDGAGIVAWAARNCTIVGNRCANLAQGIHLNEAASCYIASNNVTSNNYQGINIRYSNYNTVTDNRITSSSQHGVALVGTSRFNVIHHNYFIDNGMEETYRIDGEERGELTSQGFDEGSNNTWYDAAAQEGNWWSDYSGTGSYLIDGPSNSTDMYPIVDDEPQTLALDPMLIAVAIAGIGGVVILLAWASKRFRSHGN